MKTSSEDLAGGLAWTIDLTCCDTTRSLVGIGAVRQEVSPEFAEAFRSLLQAWEPAPGRRKGVVRKRNGAKTPRRGRGRPSGRGRPRSKRGGRPSASERRTLRVGRSLPSVSATSAAAAISETALPDFRSPVSRPTSATRPPVGRVSTARPSAGSGETPPRRTRGKPCPKCRETVGPRTRICFCGHDFYALPGVSE